MAKVKHFGARIVGSIVLVSPVGWNTSWLLTDAYKRFQQTRLFSTTKYNIFPFVFLWENKAFHPHGIYHAFNQQRDTWLKSLKFRFCGAFSRFQQQIFLDKCSVVTVDRHESGLFCTFATGFTNWWVSPVQLHGENVLFTSVTWRVSPRIAELTHQHCKRHEASQRQRLPHWACSRTLA